MLQNKTIRLYIWWKIIEISGIPTIIVFYIYFSDFYTDQKEISEVVCFKHSMRTEFSLII